MIRQDDTALVYFTNDGTANYTPHQTMQANLKDCLHAALGTSNDKQL
jgi:hypothetical protein